MGGVFGSSDVGSVRGTSQNNIEADLFFPGSDGQTIDSYIKLIIADLGTEFSLASPVTSFLPPETDLLKGLDYVTRVSDDDYNSALSALTNIEVEVPLKTEVKSNLNTYFGKGKIKDKYSPRSWYEVELIVPMGIANRDALPKKVDGPFRVITPEKYSFFCERQGTNDKNLRSKDDLRILGKWIKGEMENKGVIRCGQMVTPDTLHDFGKNKLVFRKVSDGSWLVNLQ
jgi:hypothetical protein